MGKSDIEFIRVTYLRGPNIWTYRPVVEAWVDIGDLEDSPSNAIPGFYDRLTGLLPSLAEHRCSIGEPGGFLQRLREGTWPAHILEHVTLELQNLIGQRTGFGKARSTSRRGIYKVAVRSRQEQVTRACLEAGRDLLMAAIEDRPFDIQATIARLQDIADRYCLGPSTACIVDAATERRIPSLRLTEGNLVQLGYGAAQRRIWTAETDRTSAIAESIASDKDLTKWLLKSCGVPVPEGEIVKTPEEAWEVAQDIGLPVVVKPSDGNHGRGVFLELTTHEEVTHAFNHAEKHGSDVIVERFIPGNEHRLLVVGGKVVAAARGESAWVVGDGKSSVQALAETQLNTDPRRGATEEFPLNLVNPAEDGAILHDLERQGLTPASIPEVGRRVLIQRNGNVAFEVTERVHPDVEAIVSLATRVVGLDIAGVDLVAEDIGRPLEAQGGAIVEVNAGPGLLMHLKPADGAPRPVGKAIVEHLFPSELKAPGRVPIVGVAGAEGTTLPAKLIARLLHLKGHHVGLACADGLFLDRRQVEKGDCTHWKAGYRVLLNRTVDAAVFEAGPRNILAEGLAYDRCQVGVIMNIGQGEGLEEFFIHEADQAYNVLRTQIDIVSSDGVGVINADDASAVEMADLCDGEVVFFSLSQLSPVLAAHTKNGGRAVTLGDSDILLIEGHQTIPVMSRAAVSHWASIEGAIPALLAAVAVTWTLGVPAELIKAGIETIDPASPQKNTHVSGSPATSRLEG